MKVIISHKNIDNIAKYHILNRISNLYFDGSLPKSASNENQFKFSDFKFDKVVELEGNGKCAIRVDIMRVGEESKIAFDHSLHGYVSNATSTSLGVVDSITDTTLKYNTLAKAQTAIRGIVNRYKKNGRPIYSIHDFSVDWEGWKLTYVDDNGSTVTKTFDRSSVQSVNASTGRPPYFVMVNGEKWFLE